jgi:siroheme synthase-like protein
MEYLPIFIDLRGKSVLVIGQYRVLEFKVEKLLEAGAKIKLISNSLSAKIQNYIESGQITHYKDNFKEKHLYEVWLVICGSDDAELKTKIAQATESRNIFCNFVDEAPISSFISPSVFTRGDITIAISTKGKSPALNKYIKNIISNTIGVEYEYLAELLGKIRPKVINNIPNLKRRSALFDAIVKNPKVLDLIRKNQHAQAEQLVMALIDKEITYQN